MTRFEMHLTYNDNPDMPTLVERHKLVDADFKRRMGPLVIFGLSSRVTLDALTRAVLISIHVPDSVNKAALYGGLKGQIKEIEKTQNCKIKLVKN